MVSLSVNVNKVALLRNSRSGEVPSPLRAARLALQAGADGITIHPRPDERHIRRSDARHLADLLREPAWADREYNIEGNPFLGHYMELVRDLRPHQCTLVPDAPDQSTSDHGWTLDEKQIEQLKPIVAELQQHSCRVSLFMDPVLESIGRAPETGADRVELYTENYAIAHAAGGEQARHVHEQYARAAECAHEHNLGLNAGHDLNLANLPAFMSIPHLLEVSIGHALVADALMDYGMQGAVRAYLNALQPA